MTHVHVERWHERVKREVDAALLKRDPGYATANVVPLTDEDMARLSSLWHAAFPHGEYGVTGCALCRRIEAERVAALFPDESYTATMQHTDRTTL